VGYQRGAARLRGAASFRAFLHIFISKKQTNCCSCTAHRV
jgi:hypothetical protein